MALIRFLVDYRGVLTDEHYYKAGTIADLPRGQALIDEGRAVRVEVEPPAPKSPAKKRTRKKATKQ